MTLTIFGAIFLLPALIIWAVMPRYLLPLLVISSIFEAASVVDVSVGGSVTGIMPYYFVAVLIAIRMLAVIASGRMRIMSHRWVRLHYSLLFFFVLYAACTAIIYPYLFRGIGVATLGETLDPSHMGIAPLSWTWGNFAQTGYLILNYVVLLYTAHTIRDERSLQGLVSAIYIAVGIVTFFAFYERISFLAGLPYPYELLNSNPNRGYHYYQITEGVLRISSTFPEARYVGSSLVSFLAFMLIMHIKGYRSPRYTLGIVAVVAALLATTSTTGYAGLALLALLMYFAYVVAPFLRARVNARVVAIGALVALGAGVAVLLTPNAGEVLTKSIVNKSEGASFMMRIVADIYALELTTFTYGFGVGLGSTVSSSFLTYLLSNIGVFGTAFFFLTLFVLYKAITDLRHRQGPYGTQSRILSAAWWALIALIGTKMMSGPVLSTPLLWTWWLVMIGAISAVHLPEPSDRGAVRGKPPKMRGRYAGETT